MNIQKSTSEIANKTNGFHRRNTSFQIKSIVTGKPKKESMANKVIITMTMIVLIDSLKEEAYKAIN